uniref:Uncharacterized protein n=1 Tax=Rhizoctonia solani TaxID=456999 RepID=N0A588_9AGAM|nr:hypothetical protein RSOL_m00950 [Rhizoctonia solani]AGK45412.1 hypothetical protein RSOL_m00950 [Rhizoctonia solani]
MFSTSEHQRWFRWKNIKRGYSLLAALWAGADHLDPPAPYGSMIKDHTARVVVAAWSKNSAGDIFNIPQKQIEWV